MTDEIPQDLAEDIQKSEEPQAEPQEEPQAAEDKQEKYVPYGAMHEERMRRKELSLKLQEEASKREKMEETFSKVLEKFNKPEDDDDYFEVKKSDYESIKSRLEQTEKALTNQNQQSSQQQEMAQLVNRYRASAHEFAKERNDFHDAYNFYQESRIKELVASGLTQADAFAKFNQEEIEVATRSYNNEQNPAENLYKMAVTRGYKSSGNEKLENIERGQAASKSLPGGSTPQELSLESLSELKGDEFDRAWDKLFPTNDLF